MRKGEEVNFQQAERKLKKLAKGKYYSITYEYSNHQEHKTVYQECKVYTATTGWLSAKSWKIVLALLDQAINPPEVKVESIEEI